MSDTKCPPPNCPPVPRMGPHYHPHPKPNPNPHPNQLAAREAALEGSFERDGLGPGGHWAIVEVKAAHVQLAEP